MKKRLAPLALAAMSALVLSACAGGQNDTSTDGQGETLHVWIMKGTNPDADGFYDRVKTAFSDKTGATLDIEEVQWADAHDRFLTAIAGDTTPDVAETGNTWTAEFADAGALVPIDEMVDKAGLGDDLVDGLRESGTYQNELYGMPWYAGVRSIIYRTDVFDELGLTEPTTWAELVAAGEAIKAAKPDMIPFPVPGGAEQLVYPFVWGAGGQVATEKDGAWTSQLDSKKSRAGVEFYTSLALKHGLSSAGAATWKETDLLDNFAQGSVGMAIMGSWTPSAIIEKNPDLEGKIAAMPIPAQDGGIAPSALGGSHLSIFETAPNKELAFEFVQLVSTGDFAQEWADITGYFPGQKSLLATAVESTDPLVQPFAVQLVDGGTSLPVTPSFAAVQAKQTTNAMVQSILSGKQSVDEATAQAATEMSDILGRE